MKYRTVTFGKTEHARSWLFAEFIFDLQKSSVRALVSFKSHELSIEISIALQPTFIRNSTDLKRKSFIIRKTPTILMIF